MRLIPRIDSPFTPADAERITGVSTTLQRDWRRRGFLPTNDGHARFDYRGLADLLVLGALAERGIGPARAATVAAALSRRVQVFALKRPDAWNGKPRNRHMVEPMLANGGSPERFFVWGRGDARWLTVSLDDVFGTASIGGAAIILDLKALGDALVERAGLPLVCMQVQE